MSIAFIDDDFVKVSKEPQSGSDRIVTLAYGDKVEIVDEGPKWTRIRVLTYFDGTAEGFVRSSFKTHTDPKVLKFSMVDVQQGDGLVIETPRGKIILVDGGDNQLFARHTAARFRHLAGTATAPVSVEAIIVTHGDADHFDGLNEIRRSEKLGGDRSHKRLFIHPKRVLHNGLVKGPSKDGGRRIPDEERFGRTTEENGELFAIDLYDDPREAPKASQNRPFTWWAESLDHWQKRGPIELKRVDADMDPVSLFDFLVEEDIEVEIQGPFADEVMDPDHDEPVPALPYFRKPKKSAEIHLEGGGDGARRPSASHTINGHSIALRLTYGNVRFSLNGDLNQEAMDRTLEILDESELEAEIVKAPHHGSADFDFRALHATKPVVAIISSGDESANKEHIHPRATLMSALGKCMRNETGVIFCTELAAFFAKRGYSYSRDGLAKFFGDHEKASFDREELKALFTGVPRAEDPPGRFYGFERTNFGIIHVRTDGERVLAFTHSGKAGLNEAYRFSVDADHKVKFAKKPTTR